MPASIKRRRLFLAAAMSKSVAKSIGINQSDAKKMAASEGVRLARKK